MLVLKDALHLVQTLFFRGGGGGGREEFQPDKYLTGPNQYYSSHGYFKLILPNFNRDKISALQMFIGLSGHISYTISSGGVVYLLLMVYNYRSLSR